MWKLVLVLWQFVCLKEGTDRVDEGILHYRDREDIQQVWRKTSSN